MSHPAKQVFEFGPYRLDPAERALSRDDQPINLPPKLFDTLCALVERSGHLVEKDEMLKLVWRDAFVEEGSLTRAVSRLRQVLGANNGDASYIETVPKVGYRFVAKVRLVSTMESDRILERHADSRASIEETRPSALLEASTTPVPSSDWPRAAAPPSRQKLGTASMWGAGVLLAVVAILVLPRVSGDRTRDARAAPAHAITVLPFRLLGPKISDGDLGIEVAEELSARLGRLGKVAVRPAAAQGNEPARDPLQVGREPNADWILEGTIREEPHRDAYSVRLLDGPSGHVRWSRDFDAPPRDSLAAANTIALGLSEALAPEISERDRETLQEPHVERLDAYQLVMKGRLSMSRGGKGLIAAADDFELAIQKDPRYALAYTSLADCYSTLYDNLVISYADGAADARRNALKAVELDGLSADAHLSLAVVRGRFDWDWDGAEREYRRALELRPNDAGIHTSRGYFENEIGRLDAALQELRKARELNPVSPWIPTLMGETLRRSGQDDLAIEELRRAVSIDPALGAPHYKLGLLYEARGMYDTAIDEFLRCLDAYGIQVTAAAVRKANEEGGPMNAYRAWLERCEIDRSIKAVRIAQIHLVLGQPDRALDALEMGFTERSAGIYAIGTEPTLARLRSQPRFQELLRKMRVPVRSL